MDHSASLYASQSHASHQDSSMADLSLGLPSDQAMLSQAQGMASFMEWGFQSSPSDAALDSPDMSTAELIGNFQPGSSPSLMGLDMSGYQFPTDGQPDGFPKMGGYSNSNMSINSNATTPGQSKPGSKRNSMTRSSTTTSGEETPDQQAARRRAQNRESQRAFRARKEMTIKELSLRVVQLEARLKETEKLNRELSTANECLRRSIGVYQNQWGQSGRS